MKDNYGKFGQFKFKLLVKIVSIMGLVGTSLLMNVVSQAQEVRNPKPSIFNEPLYNRGKKPSETPVNKPTPASTTVPAAPTVKPNSAAPITEIKETRNLIVLANANGSFKTLIKALTAAGLIDTLQGEGPFTIFAPTDTAFAQLKDKNAVTDLLKPENRKILVDVLTYHVVPGKILSSDLKSGELKSLQGEPIKVSIDKKVVKVEYANITKADIQGSNGVIHQIDHLLIPPSY